MVLLGKNQHTSRAEGGNAPNTSTSVVLSFTSARVIKGMRLVGQLRAWRANHDVGEPTDLVMASLTVDQIISEVGGGVTEDLRVLELEVCAILKELDQWANFTDREAVRMMRTRELGSDATAEQIGQRVGAQWTLDYFGEPWKCRKCGEEISADTGGGPRDRESVFEIDDEESHSDYLPAGTMFAWGQ